MKRAAASAMLAGLVSARMKETSEFFNNSEVYETDMKIVTVGIRELKQQASELVRLVRETGSEVQVTYHGEVVALLIPVKPVRKDSENAWAKLDNLAAEIGARWPKGISAADAMIEARR